MIWYLYYRKMRVDVRFVVGRTLVVVIVENEGEEDFLGVVMVFDFM